MKKLWTVWMVCLLLCLAACGAGAAPEPSASGQSAQTEYAAQPEEEDRQEKAEMESDVFYIAVGDKTFPAAFADNAGAQALKKLLGEGSITIPLRDYGGFEKVGALGQSLPASNRQTTTQAGDIVLYQGNQIVLFYGSNTWSYTRLGRITALSGWEEALGPGDVSVTLSLAGSRG